MTLITITGTPNNKYTPFIIGAGDQVVVSAGAILTITDVPGINSLTIIDSSNNEVTSGTVTWGNTTDGVTLTVNGKVDAGANLELDIINLGQLKGSGKYIEVMSTGSIKIVNKRRKVVKAGHIYRVKGK